MAIWRMHFVRWITKATHTHTICNTYRFSTTIVVRGASLSSSHTRYISGLVSAV
jgi:hypothetical protein